MKYGKCLKVQGEKNMMLGNSELHIIINYIINHIYRANLNEDRVHLKNLQPGLAQKTFQLYHISIRCEKYEILDWKGITGQQILSLEKLLTREKTWPVDTDRFLMIFLRVLVIHPMLITKGQTKPMGYHQCLHSTGRRGSVVDTMPKHDDNTPTTSE